MHRELEELYRNGTVYLTKGMEKYKKKLIVPYEPYGDMIYVIKTYLEIKNMMEVTSGEYIKETDLTGDDDHLYTKETDLTGDDDHLYTKETCLTGWDDHDSDLLSKINSEYNTSDEVSSQASFSDICDEFSKFLSQDGDLYDTKETDLTTEYNNDGISEALEKNTVVDIKETDLTVDNNIKETDFINSNNIRETDLPDSNNIKETDLTNSNNIKETDFTNSNNIKETDLTDSNNIKETDLTDSNNIKETDLTDSINIKETDLSDEHDIKETDLTDFLHDFTDSVTRHLPDNNIDSYHVTYDNVKFQDIDTDYFETDYENIDEEDDNQINVANCESKLHLKTTGYFQDIESDFFEDEIDSPAKESPNDVTVSKSKKSKIRTVNDDWKLDRTSEMSNTLLRSTINELERALNDSNVLLAKRDQKIQELRNQNIELKKELNTELTTNSEVKLEALKKEALLADGQLKIVQLEKQLENAHAELSDLRLYKLNNIADTDHTKRDAIQSNSSDEEAHNKSGLTSETHQAPCRYRRPSNEYKCKKNPNDMDASKCSSDQSSRQANNSQSRHCKSQGVPNSEEKVSKTELHSNLRMRFMRDAFFYYMIGFHPDEQINAILAILDYGDKRQDFVLEAHKMKKSGKTFSVTKVSSRGLTFVQKEMK